MDIINILVRRSQQILWHMVPCDDFVTKNRSGIVAKAWEKEQMTQKWEETTWAKKLAAKERVSTIVLVAAILNNTSCMTVLNLFDIRLGSVLYVLCFSALKSVILTGLN